PHPTSELHLAGRSFDDRGRNECHGRGRIVFIISGNARDGCAAGAGERYEYGGAVAGAGDLSCDTARRCAQGSAAGGRDYLSPGWRVWSGGAAPYRAANFPAFNSLADPGG